MRHQLSSRDWFGKASAALILGFLLALGTAGLFRILGSVEDAFMSTKGQVAMWMMAPVWALVLSLCFFFRSGVHAWGWLAAANAVLWSMIAILGGLNL